MSTRQIIHSVSWSIDVEFPSPFKEMLNVLSISSFDFFGPECLVHDPNHFVTVYMWSAIPMAVALLLVVFHVAKRALVHTSLAFPTAGTNDPSSSTTTTTIQC